MNDTRPRAVMVRTSCGAWKRVAGTLIDLEAWNAEHPEFPHPVGFGMGSAPAVRCDTHGILEAVTEHAFWEWHVFCLSCRHRSWHGQDVEKAREDYARHTAAHPDHRLRCGLDGFTGDVNDESAQGVLFETDDEAEQRVRAAQQRLDAIRRANRPAASSRKGTTVPVRRGPSVAARVSFNDLMDL